MQNFKMMSYEELQGHLEGKGFSVKSNDTWQDLCEAAEENFSIEKRQHCATTKIVLGEKS